MTHALMLLTSLLLLAGCSQLRRRRPGFWLAVLIPLPVLLTSCSDKRTDPVATEPPPGQQPHDTATRTPKTPVMVITYQTQTTPNQYQFPPGGRAIRGEEIRYLDLANKRMRIEIYGVGNSGKTLLDAMIVDETGSYRLNPVKNEAVFSKMTAQVPVWGFEDKVSKAWAQERKLTIDAGKWLGRSCDVVSIPATGKVWLWNDIPLKKETKTVGSDMISGAYRIEESASIDASLLQVPAGMNIRPIK